MLILIKLVMIIAVGGGVAAGGTAAVLVATGTPTPCTERYVYASDISASGAKTKWQIFRMEASQGYATVEFTESEMASLGMKALGSERVKDFKVFFCQGYAEATGTAKGVDFLVRGDVDLTGAIPQARIIDVEVGGLPQGVAVTNMISKVEEEMPYFNPGVKITSIKYNWPVSGVVQVAGEPR